MGKGKQQHRKSDTEPWKVRRHPQDKGHFQVVSYEDGAAEAAYCCFDSPREAQQFADAANEMYNYAS